MRFWQEIQSERDPSLSTKKNVTILLNPKHFKHRKERGDQTKIEEIGLKKEDNKKSLIVTIYSNSMVNNILVLSSHLS